jgi:hypothetical protein
VAAHSQEASSHKPSGDEKITKRKKTQLTLTVPTMFEFSRRKVSEEIKKRQKIFLLAYS